MFSSEQWLANSGSNFYNGVISQSLRLDRDSSYNFNRQIGTVTSVTGTICTYSFWFKHTNKGTIMPVYMMCRDNQGSGNYAALWGYDVAFAGTQHLTFYGESATGSPKVGTNTSVFPFRDPSAWYHMVVRMDTTQSTASNRIRIYINGVDYAPNYTSPDYGSLNYVNPYWNNTGEWQIIGGDGGNVGTMDGYIAECNWIDGQSLPPESFGELKNGVWIPIEYSGTYGAQGWRLNFSNSSNIGADSSGNGNNFTTTTNLVASDIALDSPENNFNTQNPLSKGTYTFAEGNLKLSRAGGTSQSSTIGTISVPSGKWYWEVKLISGQSSYPRIGMFNTALGNNHMESKYPADNDLGARVWGSGGGTNSIFGDLNASGAFGSYTNGDVLQFALDMDNYKMYMGKNDTWYTNSATTTDKANISDSSANPAFGSATNLDINAGDSFTPCIFANAGADIWVANFGQDSTFAGAISAGGNADANGIGDFAYAPPNSYLALCTANLPEPNIGANSDTQADDHFNTVLYSGTGSSQAITGVGFQPDLVWSKSRSAGQSHAWIDSSRGGTKSLGSDWTGAEGTDVNMITSFDTDGFSLGSGAGVVNNNAVTYATWNWLANGGTTSSNTDGSITSTVQANTDAGFSIVTYTSNNSAGATVGHGLGVAPQMVIIKKRNVAERWFVWHTGDSTKYMYLNETFTGQANLDDRFGNNTTVTLPSSTVLTLGTHNDVNGVFGSTYVSYCFAEVEGYSKFGSYTGNSSADGPFVALNFSPAFIMVKSITTTFNWVMFDNKRDTFNFLERRLHANDSIAEVESNLQDFDFLSNGFKPRRSAGDWNATGSTYIYMAFAESPFKYANAR